LGYGKYSAFEFGNQSVIRKKIAKRIFNNITVPKELFINLARASAY